MANVFEYGVGPSLVHMSFHPVKWRDSIRNMSLKSASNNQFNIISKVMLFVLLPIYTCTYTFAIVGNLTVPLQIGTSFIYSFVNGIFRMERRMVPMQSRPVAGTSYFTPSRTCSLNSRQTRSLTLILTSHETVVEENLSSGLPSASQFHRLLIRLNQSRSAVPDFSTGHYTLIRCKIKWFYLPQRLQIPLHRYGKNYSSRNFRRNQRHWGRIC